MIAHDPKYNKYSNPSVCCPKKCGEFCNECLPSVLASDYQQVLGFGPAGCSSSLNTMCNQGDTSEGQCCASSAAKNKMCTGLGNAPCRLSKKSSYHSKRQNL